MGVDRWSHEIKNWVLLQQQFTPVKLRAKLVLYLVGDIYLNLPCYPVQGSRKPSDEATPKEKKLDSKPKVVNRQTPKPAVPT